jgi:hypothetical protein
MAQQREASAEAPALSRELAELQDKYDALMEAQAQSQATRRRLFEIVVRCANAFRRRQRRRRRFICCHRRALALCSPTPVPPAPLKCLDRRTSTRRRPPRR